MDTIRLAEKLYTYARAKVSVVYLEAKEQFVNGALETDDYYNYLDYGQSKKITH